jgi:hypothetical protein
MAVHGVTFTGDNNAQQPALVFGPKPASGATLDKLIVWQGSDGWAEKTSVPHGSAEQGFTWH